LAAKLIFLNLNPVAVRIRLALRIKNRNTNTIMKNRAVALFEPSGVIRTSPSHLARKNPGLLFERGCDGLCQHEGNA
jgi:hypothetical protein